MISTVWLLAALLAYAVAHSSSDERVERQSLAEARAEANRLLFDAALLLDADKLNNAEDLESGGLPVLNNAHGHGHGRSSSSSSSDDDDSSSGDDDDDSSSNHYRGKDVRHMRHKHDDNHMGSTTMSTSDRIHIAVEERLIEQAIENALADSAPAAAPVLKKAYQARYEISQFNANELLDGDELNFGPTVITTRSNFYLNGALEQSKDTQLQFNTAGDFLDADNDGAPDVLTSLTTFRDDNDPSDYMRTMRNRAVGADAKTGTINLINLIRMDGVFSQTNQLLSPCFSATNEDEFVFETFVGVEPGQAGVLSANPTQTESILLSGSTAVLVENGVVSPNPNRNVFWDSDADRFVSVAEISLMINLFPDVLIPGEDTIARQGTVYFTECSQFNYFQ